MLDQTIKTQVTTLFQNLKSNFMIRVGVATNHPSKSELVSLLEEVASCSDKISLQLELGSGLSFSIQKLDPQSTMEHPASSILFHAIPTGHEFSTLLLAILNMDGIGKNLPDAFITKRIQSLQGPVQLKSYISLTCTNCPDVVQALNVLAILNPAITHEIIDGALHQEEVDQLGIQAVPSVYLNGELLHVGRSDLGELLNKIEEKVGSVTQVKSTEAKHYDVLVVGGGPAGVSAAIYSARKGLNVAILTDRMGGQLTETLAIENMISIPHTTGKQLASNLRAHLIEYPIDILENRKVEKVEVVEGMKQITTSAGELFISPALILATGASWRRLNVPGEQQYIGSGVAFCAHCDGPFYKNKRVVVIGGGNSGLEAAIDLSYLASDVTVLEFMPELKGDQILQEKLKTLSNVKIITHAETKEVVGDGNKVTGLRFVHRGSGLEEVIETDGVFVQIGLKPNSDIVKPIVETSKFGEVLIDAHCRTSVRGIYAAGDVTTVPFKQIVIAMGEGSKAALSAFEDRLKDKLL